MSTRPSTWNYKSVSRPSFETATEPVIGRAFARPVGGLLRMRSNLLKHNNLMLRSERRERLEAWAASELTDLIIGARSAHRNCCAARLRGIDLDARRSRIDRDMP